MNYENNLHEKFSSRTVSTVTVELVIVVMSEPVTVSTRYMYIVTVSTRYMHKVYEKVWL